MRINIPWQARVSTLTITALTTCPCSSEKALAVTGNQGVNVAMDWWAEVVILRQQQLGIIFDAIASQFFNTHAHSHTQIYMSKCTLTHKVAGTSGWCWHWWALQSQWTPPGLGWVRKETGFLTSTLSYSSVNLCRWGAAIFYSYCWWSTGQVSQVWWVSCVLSSTPSSTVTLALSLSSCGKLLKSELDAQVSGSVS